MRSRVNVYVRNDGRQRDFEVMLVVRMVKRRHGFGVQTSQKNRPEWGREEGCAGEETQMGDFEKPRSIPRCTSSNLSTRSGLWMSTLLEPIAWHAYRLQYCIHATDHQITDRQRMVQKSEPDRGIG